MNPWNSIPNIGEGRARTAMPEHGAPYGTPGSMVNIAPLLRPAPEVVPEVTSQEDEAFQALPAMTAEQVSAGMADLADQMDGVFNPDRAAAQPATVRATTAHQCLGAPYGPTAKPSNPKDALGDTPLRRQEGGAHYKSMKIQPVEYIHANGIGYFEGNVVKYVSRWRAKGGLQDLKKARHYLDLLIEMEGGAP